MPMLMELVGPQRCSYRARSFVICLDIVGPRTGSTG
jgi:hypothetical protein